MNPHPSCSRCSFSTAIWGFLLGCSGRGDPLVATFPPRGAQHLPAGRAAPPARLPCLPQATKQFLEEINKWTGQYNVSPLSWNVAVKFLMARKFDVLRAIELFHSYRVRAGPVPPAPLLPAWKTLPSPAKSPRGCVWWSCVSS